MVVSYKHWLIACGVLLNGGQALAQVLGGAADASAAGGTATNTDVASPPPIVRAQSFVDEGDGRNQRIGSVLQVDQNGQLLPLANNRAQPEQGGSGTRQDDPYAPIGLRTGSFLLFPTVTQSIGHTSNAEAVNGGNSAAYSKTEIDLNLQSDWSRHDLRGVLLGDYQRFYNDKTPSLVNINGELEFRIDHSRNTTSSHGISIDMQGQGASSDSIESPTGADVTENPVSTTYKAFSEGTFQRGRLTSSLRSTLSRTEVSSSLLSDGTSLEQDDQNNTQISGLLRLTYETSPAIKPFVELGLSSVKFDNLISGTNIKADGGQYSLRTGFEFDLRDKLNGTVDVGYATHDFHDQSLDDLSAFTLNGSVNWSPERFTTVTAAFATTLNGSAEGAGSGAVTRVGTLSIARDVRANLTLGAKVSLSMQEFQKSNRTDETWQAEINTEYRVNRNAALFGRLGYETTSSNDATTAVIGLRIQQ